MGDTESCNSGILNSGWNHRCPKQRQKVGVYTEVLCRLKELNVPEAVVPGFEDDLWAHFYRLPARHNKFFLLLTFYDFVLHLYALDMNMERAEEVLMHKRLLDIARAPTTATGPAVEVRLVQITLTSNVSLRLHYAICIRRTHYLLLELGNIVGQGTNVTLPFLQTVSSASSSAASSASAGGSSKSLLSNSQSKVCPEDSGIPGNTRHDYLPSSTGLRPMHEITISTNDKPKLLSQLTSLLSETGLDILEAHAFSTIDGYSLDVFVVGGWPVEGTEKLKHELAKKIQKLQQHQLKENGSLTTSTTAKQVQTGMNFIRRIDAGCLSYEKKIASGPFSDLYKGTFCNQDVAIKVLKHENLNENILREFAQEVYILSKIEHKNVVKFVGACTKPPNLYLVTEYMPGGSMFDFLHKQKTTLALPSLLKVAIDVCEGMKYLHQNNIIHRDLKAANLLIDENGVVKVADFGVARMHNQSGIMTAETGTYRWMAPEVIEHKPYDHKADVFSFAVVLWELLTGKFPLTVTASSTVAGLFPETEAAIIRSFYNESCRLPYENLSPLQAAVGVIQKGLRPKIPSHAHPKLVELLHWCWHHDSSLRPNFSEILEFLLRVTKTGLICGIRENLMNQREEVVLDFQGNYGRSNSKEENLASKAIVNRPSDKLQDSQENPKGSESTKKRKQDQHENHHLQTSYSEENVVRSTSNISTPRYSWKSSIRRTKSRLIDPPEESYTNSESGEQKLPENYESVEDMPEIYKKTRLSAFSILQWLCLASIIVALLSNLWISCLQKLKLCGLPLWEWETMILVLICGRLLAGWIIKLIVFFVERNFILRKRVLYFVYGLRNSVKNCVWLGLVLLVWHFILVKAVEKKVNDRILSYVTKVVVCLFVGTVMWLLKTILVKVFALHFHVKTFFERVREALFSQYVIETLSCDRLREEDGGEDRSVGRVLCSNKKQDEEMSIEQLHRLNKRNISAWNMKRMINIVMHGAFTTLDERISCSDIEDEPLLQLRSECQAKIAAQKIFQNVVQPGSQCIFLQDVMQFMPRDEALKSMDLLGAACIDQGISMSSLREWMVHAFRERRTLALSLKDTKTAVDDLHNLLNIIVGFVILIVWLVILGTPILHFLVFMGSQLLLAVFVFGNSCRTVFEAIIFLFVMHPFDVGDLCEVDGVQMVVEEMNILTTVFLKYDNQKVTYPNSVLATKLIGNYQRSPHMGDAVDFCIHISTPLDKVATMKRRIIEYIERKNEHWHVAPMVVMKDVEELNKVNMSVWLTHKMNFQDMKERWNRKAQLIEEMMKVWKELDVEYRLLPIHVNVRNQPPLLSNKLPSNWETCATSVS
ncbi:unnamed protein product [Sphenostylis stenocarpa]|uniref:Uncharacterized protein n=1 Tax=Sphenostylis stenocarpa TaxID=92480 RepID=A0AA86VSX4_9FABA|nr:unnamed protein product [Sphenostylis stenocarpa]